MIARSWIERVSSARWSASTSTNRSTDAFSSIRSAATSSMGITVTRGRRRIAIRQAFTTIRLNQASNRSGSCKVGSARQAAMNASWTASSASSVVPKIARASRNAGKSRRSTSLANASASPSTERATRRACSLPQGGSCLVIRGCGRQTTEPLPASRWQRGRDAPDPSRSGVGRSGAVPFRSLVYVRTPGSRPICSEVRAPSSPARIGTRRLGHRAVHTAGANVARRSPPWVHRLTRALPQPRRPHRGA